jgi:hypothetical protein
MLDLKAIFQNKDNFAKFFEILFYFSLRQNERKSFKKKDVGSFWGWHE